MRVPLTSIRHIGRGRRSTTRRGCWATPRSREGSIRKYSVGFFRTNRQDLESGYWNWGCETTWRPAAGLTEYQCFCRPRFALAAVAGPSWPLCISRNAGPRESREPTRGLGLANAFSQAIAFMNLPYRPNTLNLNPGIPAVSRTCRSREAGEPAHGECVDGPSETLPPTRPTNLKRWGRVKLVLFSHLASGWTGCSAERRGTSDGRRARRPAADPPDHPDAPTSELIPGGLITLPNDVRMRTSVPVAVGRRRA